MAEKTLDGIDEFLSRLTVDQKQQLLHLLRQRKKQNSSQNESKGFKFALPHRDCNNCAYASVEQPFNDPYLLVPSCPSYPERKYNEEIERMVCPDWQNRRYGMKSFDGEDDIEDGDGIEEGEFVRS